MNNLSMLNETLAQLYKDLIGDILIINWMVLVIQINIQSV